MPYALKTQPGRVFPPVARFFLEGRCNIGVIGVGWFYMLSGSVLQKNYADGLDIRSFYKKRVLRLYIPLWIAYIFFYIICYIFNPWIRGVPFYSVLTSLLGMDFYYYYFVGTWNLILVGEWFTAIIITLYILFPLIHFLFSRCRKWVTPALLVLFVLNLRLEILTASSGNWSLINGLVLFWIGMLFLKSIRKS